MARSPRRRSAGWVFPRVLRPRRAPQRPRRRPHPPSALPTAPCRLLGILQRDSRLVDFLMEDITGYSDDQVGAAVRELHDQCRDAVGRYVSLTR